MRTRRTPATWRRNRSTHDLRALTCVVRSQRTPVPPPRVHRHSYYGVLAQRAQNQRLDALEAAIDQFLLRPQAGLVQCRIALELLPHTQERLPAFAQQRRTAGVNVRASVAAASRVRVRIFRGTLRRALAVRAVVL